MAAVVGHWHSVFTGFRGGDGLATLGGITIALFLIPGFIAAVVASAVTLVAQKTPVTSLAGTVFGYITLAALGFAYELGLFPYEANLSLTLGVGALFAMVLARAFKSNLRLRRGQDFAEVSEEDMFPTRNRRPTAPAFREVNDGGGRSLQADAGGGSKDTGSGSGCRRLPRR